MEVDILMGTRMNPIVISDSEDDEEEVSEGSEWLPGAESEAESDVEWEPEADEDESEAESEDSDAETEAESEDNDAEVESDAEPEAETEPEVEDAEADDEEAEDDSDAMSDETPVPSIKPLAPPEPESIFGYDANGHYNPPHPAIRDLHLHDLPPILDVPAPELRPSVAWLDRRVCPSVTSRPSTILEVIESINIDLNPFNPCYDIDIGPMDPVSPINMSAEYEHAIPPSVFGDYAWNSVPVFADM